MKWLFCFMLSFTLILLWTTKGYGHIKNHAPIADSTIVWGKGVQLMRVPFSYQTRQLNISTIQAEDTELLPMNLHLATGRGFEEYQPKHLSRPDFVFIRFSIFNRWYVQKK